MVWMSGRRRPNYVIPSLGLFFAKRPGWPGSGRGAPRGIACGERSSFAVGRGAVAALRPQTAGGARLPVV